MAWSTPKIDWATDDAIGVDDLNRIEGNTDSLGKRLGTGAATPTIASANSLAITAANSVFFISGNTEIYYIKTTDRLANSRITLIFNSNLIVHHDQAGAGAGYAKISIVRTGGGGDMTTGAGTTVSFVYDGTIWQYVGF
jgi:hypothetical protein